MQFIRMPYLIMKVWTPATPMLWSWQMLLRALRTTLSTRPLESSSSRKVKECSSHSVKGEYSSGHSVRQSPHQPIQVSSDLILISIKQPPLYYSHYSHPIGDQYSEVPL